MWKIAIYIYIYIYMIYFYTIKYIIIRGSIVSLRLRTSGIDSDVAFTLYRRHNNTNDIIHNHQQYKRSQS